jgi:hypothetical protein
MEFWSGCPDLYSEISIKILILLINLLILEYRNITEKQIH